MILLSPVMCVLELAGQIKRRHEWAAPRRVRIDLCDSKTNTLILSYFYNYGKCSEYLLRSHIFDMLNIYIGFECFW